MEEITYSETIRDIFKDILLEIEKKPEAFRCMIIHLENGENIVLRRDKKEWFRIRGNYLIVYHLDVDEKFGEANVELWRIPLANVSYVIETDPSETVDVRELYSEIYGEGPEEEKKKKVP